MKNTLTMSLLITGIFGISGCNTVATGVAFSNNYYKERYSTTLIIPPPYIADINATNELEKRFSLFALFSETVYHDDINLNSIKNKGNCEELSKAIGAITKVSTIPAHSNWSLLEDKSYSDACINESGLHYETFVHKSNGAIDIAVIAFRGTENNSWSTSLQNWDANFHELFFPTPSHIYDIARKKTVPLIAKLKEKNQSIKIYTTGHSLGGGIAQEIAYLSKGVDEVFAFDPSPVTSWTAFKAEDMQSSGEYSNIWTPKKECQTANPNLSLFPNNEKTTKEGCTIKNDWPIVHRIYHSYEVLSYIRNVIDRIAPKHFNRYDYIFHYLDNGGLPAHDMRILTCAFLIKSKNSDVDEFYFRKDDISALLSQNQRDGLCPDELQKTISGNQLKIINNITD